MSRLVVALDFAEVPRAERLVEQLQPLGVLFKIGYEALYHAGDQMRAVLERSEAPYFLDVKLHDIPRTVERAVRALVRPGLHILNVHALGGVEMMRAAVEAAAERAAELQIRPPHVFAVTLLTSIAPEDLRELGLSGGPQENVTRLAALARDAGCSGVICGATEVHDLKAFFGETFLTLCPGIRPLGASHDDQKRVATPAQAATAGADYLVVGRPVTQAASPTEAARAILDEIASAAA